MNFWEFMTTGIGGVESERHKRFVYANAIISTLAATVTGGLTGWLTNGSWVWIMLSAAAAVAAVYLISFILFTEGSQ